MHCITSGGVFDFRRNDYCRRIYTERSTNVFVCRCTYVPKFTQDYYTVHCLPAAAADCNVQFNNLFHATAPLGPPPAVYAYIM